MPVTGIWPPDLLQSVPTPPTRTAPLQLLLHEIPLPDLPDADAIWGATGRDHLGRIWIGVSGKRFGSSGHLLRFDPATRTWAVVGRVLDELDRAGLAAPGMGQVKLHSRIVQARDGWMYFTSMDEEGERDDGSALPKWGSHLWRVHPETLEWQHRFASRDALIALGAAEGSVWALGYWNHVVVHHDVNSGLTTSTAVGSVGGHISRNLVVDARGHAFVPRVTPELSAAELIELDRTLVERSRSPMPGYDLPGDPAGNHGITGLVTRADGVALFTTHTGRLYAISPDAKASPRVEPLGDFHPAGGGYAPSLFRLDDGATLAGVVQRGSRFDWVERDIGRRSAFAAEIDTSRWPKLLLYGSVTRDDAGRCYVVGRTGTKDGNRPLVIAVERRRD